MIGEDQTQEVSVIPPDRPSRSWFHLWMACEIPPFLCSRRKDLLSQRLPYTGVLCRLIDWSMEELSGVPS